MPYDPHDMALIPYNMTQIPYYMAQKPYDMGHESYHTYSMYIFENQPEYSTLVGSSCKKLYHQLKFFMAYSTTNFRLQLKF